MTTNQHPQRLLAYLDGELSAEEGQRVEAHLAVCDRCQRELAGHRQLHAYLDVAIPTPVPGEFWSELQTKLGPPRGRRAPRAAFAGYLAVALLGLGVGGWAGWSMGEELDGESSPELLAESSLYDLPEESVSRSYLETTLVEPGEEVSP